MKTFLPALSSVALLALQSLSSNAATAPVSAGTGHASVAPNSVSADGRYVVFTSYDTALAAHDTNGLTDVYLRDLATGVTRPVSFDVEAAPGSFNSGFPVLSAEGTAVAYVRYTRRAREYWRYDVTSGQRTLIFASTNEPVSFVQTRVPTLAVSGDGRYVAFESRYEPPALASNAMFAYNGPQVFLHDVQSGLNHLISQRSDRLPASTPAESRVVQFSPDGHWVAFVGDALNLVTNSLPSEPKFHLYARNWERQETRLISKWGQGTLPRGEIGAVSWSADSRWVAFDLAVPALGLHRPVEGAACYFYDFASDTTRLLATDCLAPALSGDGRLVALQTLDSATGRSQIAVRSVLSGGGNWVSFNADNTAPGNGDSYAPLMTYDGRYVAFLSKASDLVANDTNGETDLFVRDLAGGKTLLISQAVAGGGSANHRTIRAYLGADGRTIVFQSYASDLVAGDTNERSDVFAVRLGSADGDSDGLDDDWEYAYFGDLTRDGTADSDQDGMTEAQEFRAGTCPTRDTSVLRVLMVTSLNSGQKTVLWQAQPGRRYRVQYTDTADAHSTWTDLPETITATADTASLNVSGAMATPHRFYRARLEP